MYACVYVGFNGAGLLKIGQTERSGKPGCRMRETDCTGLFYFRMYNPTKAEVLFLESVARLAASRIRELSQHKIDWFSYVTKDNFSIQEAAEFAEEIMFQVRDMAEEMAIAGQVCCFPWTSRWD